MSVFVLVTAVLEAVAATYVQYGINNLFLFHLYSYIEVLGMASIFWGIEKKWMRSVILASTLFFLLFSILNITYWESLIQFNSNQRYVAAIIIILFCLMYFIKLFIDAEIQRIEEDPYFWFTSIYLIYTTGTLFLFLFGNEVRSGHHDIDWDNIHSILNILLNIGFSITLWMGTRKKLSVNLN